MIPFSSAASSEFTWSKLAWNRGYEVRLKGTTVGALRRKSLWSSNYEATTLDGVFTFRRNCWGTKAEIVDSTSQQRIALFESSWRGPSTLTFADGQRFDIQRKCCWRPQWSVAQETGQTVLSLNMRERTADAALDTSVEARRLALLVMFVLYRIRQAEEDAASAITATVAVVASS